MMFRLFAVGTLMLWPTLAFAQNAAPVQPRNDRGTWVTRGDYPPEEYFKGIEGVTTFVITVGRDGKPKGCEIVQSSGSPVLDNIVCARVTERAKFYPARDDGGQKIESQYRNRVKWTIPPEQAAEMAKAREVGEIGVAK